MIEVPLDIQNYPVKFSKKRKKQNKVKIKNDRYLNKKIELLVKKLKYSKRPVLIAGNGIRYTQIYGVE